MNRSARMLVRTLLIGTLAVLLSGSASAQQKIAYHGEQRPSHRGPAPARAPQPGLPSHDQLIVATISKQCGGEPRCMMLALGVVELQRCRSALGGTNACFAPNSDITRALYRVMRRFSLRGS
jgi:hypothetical protein